VLTHPADERHAKISDVKNFANLVAGIRRSSRKGRFLDTFCRPGQKVSYIARKSKGSRRYFTLRISTSTLRSNKQHTTLGAAQTGTDDGLASTSMSSELRKQRTGTGIFRWSVDASCG